MPVNTTFPGRNEIESAGQFVTDCALTLRLGGWDLVLEGLSAQLESDLRARWGGFVRPGESSAPRLRVRCVDRSRAGSGLGLGTWTPGELYRLESRQVDGALVLRSYNFCMCPQQDDDRQWLLVLGGAPDEPLERTIENAVRSLVARIALQEGGFAVHGAGIRRAGKTWIYAGVSGAGKSTAVKLSAPCQELGDDFAVVVPGESGWNTMALPFDNREKAPADPVQGLLPLDGVWKLFQANVARVETPPAVVAVASLLSCVMLPALFPNLVEQLSGNVERFAREGSFGHLNFRYDPDFLVRLDEREDRVDG
jgi:hypothetical protein